MKLEAYSEVLEEEQAHKIGYALGSFGHILCFMVRITLPLKKYKTESIGK